MARVGKQKEKHHAIRLMADRTADELILVSGGKRSYLWTGAGTYSGEIALRSLAYSILREIGFHTKRRKPRRASTATRQK